jgi:thioredoxin reductase (NADPH)
MSEYLIGRIEASEHITLHTQSEIVGLDGDRHLEEVRWADRRTGREEARRISNVFLMLGAVPNSDWLRDCLVLDEKGFIHCGGAFDHANGWRPNRDPHPLETSRPGVFAVGDVRSGSIKRVASAVGEGSIVVSSIHQVLSGA